MTPLRFTLPERPPPLSACYINARGPGRVKSKRYMAWQSLCKLYLPRPERPIAAPVAVVYDFHRPDNRRRDVFNLEKAVSDLLVDAGILEDDSQIWDGRVRWGGAAPVTVRIEALGEAG